MCTILADHKGGTDVLHRHGLRRQAAVGGGPILLHHPGSWTAEHGGENESRHFFDFLQIISEEVKRPKPHSCSVIKPVVCCPLEMNSFNSFSLCYMLKTKSSQPTVWMCPGLSWTFGATLMPSSVISFCLKCNEPTRPSSPVTVLCFVFW